MSHAIHSTLHKTIDIDALEIFNREAELQGAPTILLLHGFPTSLHRFRNLISALADEYHLVVPDYPGFVYRRRRVTKDERADIASRSVAPIPKKA